jgi:hypothetical protein
MMRFYVLSENQFRYKGIGCGSRAHERGGGAVRIYYDSGRGDGLHFNTGTGTSMQGNWQGEGWSKVYGLPEEST